MVVRWIAFSAPLILILLFGQPASADLSGARINYRAIDIQFSLADEANKDVVDVLFSADGVITSLATLISNQPDEVLDKAREWTFQIDKIDGMYTVDVLGTTASQDITEFKTETKAGIISTICNLIELTGCDLRSSGDREAVFGGAGAVVELPTEISRDVVITIGELPSSQLEQQISIPSASSREDRDARILDPDLKKAPLGEAIRERASEIFGDPDVLVPSLDDRLAPTPRYFIVHCTAFAASDDSMRRWVRKNTERGTRSKSHGVVLPSGEYLSMWLFGERKVWATKTETCRETGPSALGAAINIEVHYFCARNRNDKATEEQYATLAGLYKDTSDQYGLLTVVSHREVDRGLRLGHDDPIGFSFARFYEHLARVGISVSEIKKIEDRRHDLRSAPDISHHYPPQLDGPLVLEQNRSDDCRRDH